VSWFDDHAYFEIEVPRGEFHIWSQKELTQ